jgi:hypothetical protein
MQGGKAWLSNLLSGREPASSTHGSVSVRFEVDGKVWRTHPDRIAEGR